MIYVLYAIFFISCIALVGAVLLQPGKTDAGALFTSNVSSAAFGPRGTATVLSKITIVAATVFMLSALLISMPALSGGVSVLQSAGEIPVEAPAAANTDANTAAQPDVNAAVPGTTDTTTTAPANTTESNTAPANR